MRRPCLFTLAIIVVLLLMRLPCLADPASHDEANISEERLKAAFVYNFLKFVQWPPEINMKDRITLCVKARPDMKKSLKDLEGKEIAGKRIEVVDFRNSIEMTCHALFVDHHSSSENISLLLEQLYKKPILTVSDVPDFCRKGGIIQLYLKGNKLRFDINLHQARESRIKISSRLLKLAGQVIE